jgi:hypothetical protein
VRIFHPVALVVVAMVAAVVFSHTVAASCGINRVIIHINGIQTTRAEAIDNMKQLRARYGPTYAGQPITYDYAYNNKSGFFASLAEVYFQKDVESDPTLSLAVAYAILGDTSKIVDPTLQAQIQETYVASVAGNSTAAAVVGKVQTISDKVNAYLSAGNAVVLVPHSQGCLYANSVFQKITGGTSPNGQLKVAAVASPADSVSGDPKNSSYVTAKEDLVINVTLRAKGFFSGWTVLPWTVEALSNGQALPDGLGHSFIQLYLSNEFAAWPKIKQIIDTAMGALQPSGQALVSSIWDPTYSGMDFHMLVNGMDIIGLGGTDQNLSQGNGWANYCIPLNTASQTTYTPVVYNRGALSQAVTIYDPLGPQTATVAAESGLFPGMFFAEAMLVQNGAVSQY